MNKKQLVCMWIGIGLFMLASQAVKFPEVFKWWLVCIVITSGAIYTFRDKENEGMNFFGKIVFALLTIVTFAFAAGYILEKDIYKTKEIEPGRYQLKFGQIRHTTTKPTDREGIVSVEGSTHPICFKFDTATGKVWRYRSNFYNPDDSNEATTTHEFKKVITSQGFGFTPLDSHKMYP